MKELMFKPRVKHARVIGSIVYDCDPRDLDSDMMQVSLPNGITIDIGWVPDGDPNGSYRIVAYRDYFENQLLAPIYEKDYKLVLSTVGKITTRLATRTVPSLKYKSPAARLMAPEPKIGRLD